MSKKELAVIIPFYNEEGAAYKVISDWHSVLIKSNASFDIFAYNDGSKDKTLEVLERLKVSYPQIKVINKENSGHGPTILKGYNEGLNYQWIFQVDGDDEISPVHFQQFWSQRENYDLIIGIRTNRVSPIARKITSLFAKILIKIFYSSKAPDDVNCPYRLMRSSSFNSIIQDIPIDTFAPNVVISGVAALRNLKILQLPVTFKERTTGVASINHKKLLIIAWKCFAQIFGYRYKLNTRST